MTAFLMNTGLEESEGKFHSVWNTWAGFLDIVGMLSEDEFWVAVIGVVPQRGALPYFLCLC